MATKKIKLTPALLKKLVLEEKRKIQETLEQGAEDVAKVDAEETDADEMADSLEQDIEWMAALKIQESILKRKYAKVQAAKKRIVKKLNK